MVRRHWIFTGASLAVVALLPSAAADSTHEPGLGLVVSTSDGGQVFGWDINEHGADGVLAASQTTHHGYKVSVQTFDQVTGEITSTFAKDKGTRNSYGVDGIFAGDVGLVTHYVVPDGTIYAKRRYDVMDPVTAHEFTGEWTPPIKNIDVLLNADNQTTSTSVMYAIELKSQSRPDLVVSDFSAGTSKIIHLNQSHFSLNNGPQLAQDTTTNQAVVAASPDSGTVGGDPPIFGIVNLSTGHVTEWNGLNEGPFHAGFVNGLAVDSRTGIACTTTELNAQVEFYNLADHTGVAVQLPGTGPGDQFNSGAFVTNDPRHGLFLVANPNYALGGGSAIVVYDESGQLVESITGFDFHRPTRIAVNPKLRMGWVDGPEINQLQQFFY